MDFKQFDKQIQQMAISAKTATGLPLSKKVAALALRFVDDNFRSGSWEGTAWAKVADGGTPLIHTGALRRSFNGDDSTPGQVRIYTNVKYARVHNEGYKGPQSVPAHKRAIFKNLGKGKKVKKGITEVRAFTRQQHIKQRQFAPYEGHESPTLNKLVEAAIAEHIMSDLKI